MTLTNDEVVERFLRRAPGKGRHLWTDGDTLWSYNRPIATHLDGALVCDVKFVSPTTLRHQLLLFSRCNWDFYPWDNLKVPPSPRALREAEGVAASKLGGLYLRLKGEKMAKFYRIRDGEVLDYFDRKRFLDALDVAALKEYHGRKGEEERRRIKEALLRGDRAGLIAELL